MPDHPSNVPTAVPKTPRHQWRVHPHWGSQVLLVESHESFRRISRHLIGCAEDREDVASIRALFVRWTGAMRSHEAYEEHKLYPFLARRWRVSCSDAQAGHVRLHECGDRVLSSMVAVANDAAAEARWAELTEALRAHDQTLHAHLELEEELVVPLLLELRPREFQILTMLPIEQLLERIERRGAIDAPATTSRSSGPTSR